MGRIEEQVIDFLRSRLETGKRKYGITTERDDLNFLQWLQHIQEELLDAAVYVEKLKEVFFGFVNVGSNAHLSPSLKDTISIRESL